MKHAAVPHRKPTTVTPAAHQKGMNPWKVAAITFAVLFIAIIIFRNLGPSSPAGPTDQAEQQTAPAGQQNDQAPQLADTSKDPEIGLMIINDKTCGSCDTSQVLQVIQTQLFPTTKVRTLDYSEAEAKKLVTDLNIPALPAYIFDATVTQGANYDKVATALIKKGDLYLVHPAAVGAGKYLNPPSADDDPVEGDAKAPVTIIEFSDFQCPFCGKFFKDTLPQLRNEYIKTGRVKLVYRDYPLDFHPYAQKAAEAADCADEQGKFWQMHDKLFDNQDAITASELKKYAADLGLDTAKFNNCLDTSKYEQEVKKDLADGNTIGVSGTPAFFINGISVSGAQPYSVFKQIIDGELAK